MRKFSKIAIGTILLLTIVFSLTSCGETFETISEKKVTAFLQTVPKEQRNQTADSENLAQKPLSILNDRLFLQLPEGAAIMTQKQQNILFAKKSTNSVAEQRIAWGGSGEVLALRVSEMFSLSDSIEQDTANYLSAYAIWKTQEINKIGENAAAASFPFDQISRNYTGELTLMRAMALGAGNTLISIEFSLYTTAFEQLENRFDFYQELAISILETATPGTRVLGANEQTVVFEQLEFTLSVGYCETQNQKQVITSQGEKQNATLSVRQIAFTGIPFSTFKMEIGDDFTEETPASVIETKEDIILGKSVVWEHQQIRTQGGYLYTVWTVLVPLDEGENLKIKLYPETDDDLKQMFKMIDTLEKK